jgi:hypothetical protein
MSVSFASEIGGRAASLARRLALSAGKAALPPATERTSAGRNGAPSHAIAVPAPAPASQAVPVARQTVHAANGSLSGRLVSIARRRELSAGKAGANGTAHAPAPPASTGMSAREIVRARRAALSSRGRGDAPPPGPTRPPRAETIADAPQTLLVTPTQSERRVTGVRSEGGSAVTGAARGGALSVSGTPYIGAESGNGWRAGGPKVGLARTPRGLVVSGTLVRSLVRVTGDEAGSGIAITGEADQHAHDDLTPRSPATADSNGTAAFGTNFGRSSRTGGSRERRLQPAIESTFAGLPVTGSALGRSLRVTGDEAGSCRRVTGDQYLAPAELQAECGGLLGGTAPAAHLGAGRPDPVTGAKVRVAQTWAGRRLTGIDVEQNPRVSGDARGSGKSITGSQYQSFGAAAKPLPGPRSASSPVTGDTPRDAAGVTGTARGAARSITGTPYYAAGDATPVLSSDPVATLDTRFSVSSPQRSAQLRADAEAATASAAERITGSFAVGTGKITGNLEFTFRPRRAPESDSSTRISLTGEGSSAGTRITGGAGTEHSKVTGTEARSAVDRNPSERGSKPRPFAGAGRFKTLASHEEPKHLVTGMFGYASDSGAKVTLSGGAQG